MKQLADDFNDEVRLVKHNQPCNFYVRVAKLDEFEKDQSFSEGRTIFAGARDQGYIPEIQ